ncbi:cytochrome c [Candidatus Acetothermia bacterium]|nr:cytochrome c [Candidatus Acetothermia bacterium]MBI3643197.1 cytochrome c [Candidatus Acetothermia bacterium]
MKNMLTNALLALISLLFLLFVGVKGLALLQNLLGAPAVESASKNQDVYAGLAPEKIGIDVFEKQGCMACHNLDLKGGTIAPSLDNFAERWNGSADQLKAKLLDPKSVVPNSIMPSFGRLSDEELDGVVAYLLTLKSTHSGPDNADQATISIPTLKDTSGKNDIPKFSMDQVKRGQELFMNNGCIGCHTVNGVAKGGSIGPNLTHESERKRSDEWELDHLKQPYSVYVIGSADNVICRLSTCMPGFGSLSPEDLKALVAFLQSLK